VYNQVFKYNGDDAMHTRYDVIVIGGGHAGIEAAAAAARMGSHTLLVTLKKDKIGCMPCNPAIGGIGKGHMVCEISALGGVMPELCTHTYLQARMLNTRKGPAVQGLRLQIDKHAYSQASQQALENTKNLTIHEGMAERIMQDAQGHVTGIETADGTQFHAPHVILTTGTFLNGVIHVGEEQYKAGRRGENAVTGLAEFLYSLNLDMGRLKTGTPPRLLRSSVDFSTMEQQESHDLPYLFEFEPHQVHNTEPCHVTHTNETSHGIIRESENLSPAMRGELTSKPPRYCPSIEDKVHRFPDKRSHQIFVEPEGVTSDELYPNGIATSLPRDVQEKFIHSIAGFENAVITQPSYAIEYDYVAPHQLHETLELRTVPGLYLAGQINGTTGYEEAAGQGIMAGINAALKAQGRPPYVMSRNEGYIGIMINDLVTLGVDEPYRMFTSRAERRLLLRQDNAFTRLGPAAYELGLISHERYQAIEAERKSVNKTLDNIRRYKADHRFTRMISSGQQNAVHEELSDYADTPLSERARTQVYAEILYAPYKQREQRDIQKQEQYKHIQIPKSLQFTNLPGLSRELQEKLERYQPETVAQAALIQGMTPAALSLLIFKSQELS